MSAFWAATPKTSMAAMMITARMVSASCAARAADFAQPAARAASIPAATAARDWPKKTEDWQVETAAAARSLLFGDNTFIEPAMWLCRVEAEVA